MKPLNVKRLRQRLELTQDELAALVGVDKMTVWSWESRGFRSAANSRQRIPRAGEIRERLIALSNVPLETRDAIKATARTLLEKRRCPYCKGTGRVARDLEAEVAFLEEELAAIRGRTA